jgi:hypothetical protein
VWVPWNACVSKKKKKKKAFLIAGATQTQLDERVLGTSEKVVSTALLF